MKFILIINSGSTTLKVKVFSEKDLAEKFSAYVERVGLTRSFLVCLASSGISPRYGASQQENKKFQINFNTGIKDHRQALKEVIKILPDRIYRNIKVIGHRLVHGGERFTQPTILNKTVLKQLSDYNDLALLHNPINLKTVYASLIEFPRIKQIGVFDTQFFKNLPAYVYLYAIPLKYQQRYGLRKYGFHGLTHEYMFLEAAKKFGNKKLNLITCHLGGGSSITAIKDSQVLDTSMGLTPLAGVMMTTRSGDLDPYLSLYLTTKLKMTPQAVNEELNYQSGLKGIFGSGDLREVLIAAGIKVPGFKSVQKYGKIKKQQARLALKMFIFSIQKYLASYGGLLGKVDAVVFSGGIGEHSQFIRQQVLSGVHFINHPKVLIVKANEELMIAKKILTYEPQIQNPRNSRLAY